MKLSQVEAWLADVRQKHGDVDVLVVNAEGVADDYLEHEEPKLVLMRESATNKVTAVLFCDKDTEELLADD